MTEYCYHHAKPVKMKQTAFGREPEYHCPKCHRNVIDKTANLILLPLDPLSRESKGKRE